MTPAKKVTLHNVKRGRGRPKGSRNKPKPFTPAPKRAQQQQLRCAPPAPPMVVHPPPYQGRAGSLSSSPVIVVDDVSEEDQGFSTEDEEDLNHMEWDAWDWMDVCMMVRHVGSTASPYVRRWTKEQRARIANAFRECATIFDPK